MKIPSASAQVTLLLLASVAMVSWERSAAQQEYVDNKQLDCYKNFSSTSGYVCNSNRRSCSAYLTFRSAPPLFDSPTSIGYLLGANPSAIATINNVTMFDKIPKDNILLVPLKCSCSSRYFQFSANYTLQNDIETYLRVANNTYQGLTTCQALIAQNPTHDSRHLYPGIKLKVPLRCACPSRNQSLAGFNYLAAYLVAWGDTISAIAEMFGADTQVVLDANKLSAESVIYPFTTILVPLKTAPTNIRSTPGSAPPPASPSQPPPAEVPAEESNSDSDGKKWVFVGVGVGVALLVLLLSGFLVFCFVRRRDGKNSKLSSGVNGEGGGRGGTKLQTEHSVDFADVSKSKSSWAISAGGLRSAVESLTVYNFKEIQKATGFFAESNRIKGSVYRGYFNGDYAAVKITKGDVSGEVNILKQVNHSNVIRLSGFCLHEGNTYLVYEYAENGSLSDWLHSNNYASSLKSDNNSSSQIFLGWKQRVQIAYDIADAVNYLHNFTNPPHIHKNLSSSNIFLDSNLQAKIGNFGLARSMEINDEGLQLTRHVVGTQGYMPPEYIENGVVTPKMDVFAYGVVVLELLSGKEAVGDGSGKQPLWAAVREVVGGEKVREKLEGFIDGRLGGQYPMEMAYSLAQLAERCVADELNSRPAMSDVVVVVSKLLSSTLDWDPSDELERQRSTSID